MSRVLFVEGGGPAGLDARCREGFRKLLLACGFAGRMPAIEACGGRDQALDKFRTGLKEKAPEDFVGLLVDSEDPMDDIEAAWEHLKKRDGWSRPDGAEDEQVLFMATCMETWIISDHAALAAHYGGKLQTSALPALTDLEARNRHRIQDALVHATRKCSNAYQKGKRSFEVLAKLNPAVLTLHLPSFARIHRILNERL